MRRYQTFSVKFAVDNLLYRGYFRRPKKDRKTARTRPKQQRSSKENQGKSSPSVQTVSAIHFCFCFLDGFFIDEQASLLVQERGLPYILGQTSLNLSRSFSDGSQERHQ